MKRFRIICYLACVALLLLVFGGFVTQSIALAIPDTAIDLSSTSPNQKSPETEQVTLSCQYPVLSSPASASTYFTYSIDLQYTGGKEPRVFDLQVKVPDGFNYSIVPGYGETGEIAAIRLDPTKTYPDSIKVTVRPYTFLTPEPGDYSVTVEAISGSLKNSIDLKAIITARYGLQLDSSTGLLNTNATAGKDNYFTMSITNTGSADLEKINFSSSISGKPSGWSITFNPEKIDSLAAGSTREIQVNIKPVEKTIAGDYMVTISAKPESEYAFAHLDLRVTVLTPTIWGWLGVGIVVLVIAGLVVMFMRLGRR
jgi:uncharacterized membrane protein